MLTEKDLTKRIGKIVRVTLNTKTLLGMLSGGYDTDDDLDMPKMHYTVMDGDWVSIKFLPKDVKKLEVYDLKEILEVK